MSSEPALQRWTQRGRWHWRCVVKPPGVRRPLVHLRQHLTERQRHISIRWQQGDRAKRQRLIQRHGPDLGTADIPAKGTSASHPRTVTQTGLHHLFPTAGRRGAAVNRNGSFTRHIIDTGHNVDNASSIGLKDSTCFAIAGARLRRGESGVLRPAWLNGEQHRQPIHWLPLRITDTHKQCGSLGPPPDRTKPDQRVGDV
jgi:hypothetical protein